MSRDTLSRKTVSGGVAMLGVAAMAVMGVAPAQASGGQSKPDDILARPALLVYAACVVRESKPGAEKLLETDVETPGYGDTLRAYAMAHPHCVPGRKLRFGGLPFAGSLAEMLIKESYSGTSLRDRVAQAAPEADLPPHGPAEAIGMCVTRAAPDAVKAVLDTDPESQQEVAALDQTGTALTGCIRKGQTMTLNKQAVRAMYALGAWRLVSDKGVSPAAIAE